MKQLIISVRGEVDDETEASNIVAAIEASLVPFEELNPRVRCLIQEEIPTNG